VSSAHYTPPLQTHVLGCELEGDAILVVVPSGFGRPLDHLARGVVVDLAIALVVLGVWVVLALRPCGRVAGWGWEVACGARGAPPNCSPRLAPRPARALGPVPRAPCPLRGKLAPRPARPPPSPTPHAPRAGSPLVSHSL